MRIPAAFFVFLGLALASGILWPLFTTQYVRENNPLARDALERGEYPLAIRSSFDNDLAIAQRPWHGKSTAPVVIVAVIDPRNPVSGTMLEVLENATRERIADGRVRIAVKYHVIDDGSVEASDSFKYAAAGRCLEEREAWIPSLQALIRGDTDPDAVRRSVGDVAFKTCLDAESLREDAYHTRTQGTIAPSVHIGTDTRSMSVLYGEPDPEDLESMIRQYEIRFGI